MGALQALLDENGDLILDGNGGFKLVYEIKENIKQNLRMLILTNPGESVDVVFGVGIKRYLFDMQTNETYSRMESRIREQVKIFMPFVKIDRVLIQALDQHPNSIKLSLFYSVPKISLNDVLVLLE